MIFLHACPVSCVEMSDLNVCVGVGGCSSRWQDSLVAAMWSVSRAMLAEDVFNVRRNAYLITFGALAADGGASLSSSLLS